MPEITPVLDQTEEQLARMRALAEGITTVVGGDPSRTIADIERVEYVFKDGKGYDPKKLVDSVKGLVGSR